MKIDYVSDLHMEFRQYPSFSKEPGGDILLLAGDITTAYAVSPHRTDADARSQRKNFEKFKTDLLDKYWKVYWVLGNHEHYHCIFKHTANSLRNFLKEIGANHVEILDNDTIEFEDWRLIGCTLWSDYEGGNPNSMMDCHIGMNDYRLIGSMDVDDMNYFNRHESRTVTPAFLLNEHKTSVSYIREQLKRDNKRTIIMTHHAPTNVSLNKMHVGNGLDGAYASDLSDLILGHPQIEYWVHGHTHMNVNYSVGDFCHVVSNQRGYNHEPCYRHFGGVKTLKKKDV